MSDEQRKEEELDVEAHRKRAANDEQSDEGQDDEVEAHLMRRTSARME